MLKGRMCVEELLWYSVKVRAVGLKVNCTTPHAPTHGVVTQTHTSPDRIQFQNFGGFLLVVATRVSALIAYH
jgi:hypothetical protein